MDLCFLSVTHKLTPVPDCGSILCPPLISFARVSFHVSVADFLYEPWEHTIYFSFLCNSWVLFAFLDSPFWRGGKPKRFLLENGSQSELLRAKKLAPEVVDVGLWPRWADGEEEVQLPEATCSPNYQSIFLRCVSLPCMSATIACTQLRKGGEEERQGLSFLENWIGKEVQEEGVKKLKQSFPWS